MEKYDREKFKAEFQEWSDKWKKEHPSPELTPEEKKARQKGIIKIAKVNSKGRLIFAGLVFKDD